MIVFTCQDRLQIHRKRSVNVENDRFSELGRVFRSPISKVLWQRLRMVKTVVFFISPTRYLETVFSLLPRRRTLQRNMFQFEWVNNKRTDSLAKTKRKETPRRLTEETLTDLPSAYRNCFFFLLEIIVILFFIYSDLFILFLYIKYNLTYVWDKWLKE